MVDYYAIIRVNQYIEIKITKFVVIGDLSINFVVAFIEMLFTAATIAVIEVLVLAETIRLSVSPIAFGALVAGFVKTNLYL